MGFRANMALIEPVQKDIGIVEWQLSDRCNYNCTYCSTKIHNQYYPKLKKYGNFIKKLRQRLNGKWLVQLGGYGEPFMVPNFLKITEKLVSAGFYIGLVTNFSFPEKDFIRFFRLTKDRILCFNASFHLGQIGLEEFINKVKNMDLLVKIPIEVSIVVCPEKLSELIKVGQKLRQNKIPVIFQTERYNEHYKKYLPHQIKKFRRSSERIYGLTQKNNFKGLDCSAGINYFILDNNGQAYACHPYRSLAKKNSGIFLESGYLGNILDGTFRLKTEKIICPADICSCPTPWRARGWTNMPNKRKK